MLIVVIVVFCVFVLTTARLVRGERFVDTMGFAALVFALLLSFVVGTGLYEQQSIMSTLRNVLQLAAAAAVGLLCGFALGHTSSKKRTHAG